MSMGKFQLTYRTSYYFTHPWEIAGELYRHIKWFCQRGYRGYADCDVWSLDWYLCSWMPAALDELVANKTGHPCGMTPELWIVRLNRMRDGFLSAREVSEMNFSTTEQAQILQKRMDKGLKMFTRYFLSLWD